MKLCRRPLPCFPKRSRICQHSFRPVDPLPHRHSPRWGTAASAQSRGVGLSTDTWSTTPGQSVTSGTTVSSVDCSHAPRPRFPRERIPNGAICESLRQGETSWSATTGEATDPGAGSSSRWGPFHDRRLHKTYGTNPLTGTMVALFTRLALQASAYDSAFRARTPRPIQSLPAIPSGRHPDPIAAPDAGPNRDSLPGRIRPPDRPALVPERLTTLARARSFRARLPRVARSYIVVRWTFPRNPGTISRLL
jgi:hypothetical protein